MEVYLGNEISRPLTPDIINLMDRTAFTERACNKHIYLMKVSLHLSVNT